MFTVRLFLHCFTFHQSSLESSVTWTRSPGLETEVALVRRLDFECFTLPLPKLDVRHPAKYFRNVGNLLI